MTPNHSERSEYDFAMAQVHKLLDRRLATSGFYLTLNTGIAALAGAVSTDSEITGILLHASLAVLLCVGLLSCWIWRSLVKQYVKLISWWYARVREIELSMQDNTQLITREYNELYVDAKGTEVITISQAEKMLTYVFSAVYCIFIFGIVLEIFGQVIP